MPELAWDAIVGADGRSGPFPDINTQRGRALLAQGCAPATDLAEVPVLESGLDFRQAHRLAGHLVRRHLADGSLNNVTPDELAAAAVEVLGRRVEISPAAPKDALDPEAAVSARTAPGGAAPEPLEAMFGHCERTLAGAAAWVNDCRRSLEAAEELLRRSVQDCLRDSAASNPGSV